MQGYSGISSKGHHLPFQQVVSGAASKKRSYPRVEGFALERLRFDGFDARPGDLWASPLSERRAAAAHDLRRIFIHASSSRQTPLDVAAIHLRGVERPALLVAAADYKMATKQDAAFEFAKALESTEFWLGYLKPIRGASEALAILREVIPDGTPPDEAARYALRVAARTPGGLRALHRRAWLRDCIGVAVPSPVWRAIDSVASALKAATPAELEHLDVQTFDLDDKARIHGRTGRSIEKSSALFTRAGERCSVAPFERTRIEVSEEDGQRRVHVMNEDARGATFGVPALLAKWVSGGLPLRLRTAPLYGALERWVRDEDPALAAATPEERALVRSGALTGIVTGVSVVDGGRSRITVAIPEETPDWVNAGRTIALSLT